MLAARLRVASIALFVKWFLPALLALANVAPATDFTIEWIKGTSNQVAVEVRGIAPEALQALRAASWSRTEWQKVLAVYAEAGPAAADIWLPPMLGEYEVLTNVIRFTPDFPAQPGLSHRAVFRPSHLPRGHAQRRQPVVKLFKIEPTSTIASTVVSAVYPSTNVLPENLLKFYVHFSASMSRGQIYDHIHLRNEQGADVELPFLEIDEELWDSSMTRLTLFIDPGRIKREVKPLEEIGPALEEGKSFTLVIDRVWRDATGNPLKQSFSKQFSVGPPDREPPDPADWKIAAPAAQTREPLKIRFPDPMDHALAKRVIRVARGGEMIAGTVGIQNHETDWLFTPEQPWTAGKHALVVQTTIEDLAGNNIGKPFEVDIFEGVDRRLTNSTVKVAFDIR